MDIKFMGLLGAQLIVVGVDGQFRVLSEGETPNVGDLLIDSNGDTSSYRVAGPDSELDVSDDIAELFEAIEQGQDPTLDGDNAPAAGGLNTGSSPQSSGTVERTAAELLADTDFDTSGLEASGVSATQILSLLENYLSVSSNDVVESVATPEPPLVVFASISAEDSATEDGGIINYVVSLVDSEGNTVLAQDLVTVTVALPDGSLQELQIDVGESTATLLFQVQRDDVYVENDSVLAQISSLNGGLLFDELSIGTSAVDTSITDDEDVTTVHLSASENANEDGGTVLYTAVLQDANDSPVTTKDLIVVTVTLPDGTLQNIDILPGESAGSIAFVLDLDDPYVELDSVTARITGVDGGDSLEKVTFNPEQVSTRVLDDLDTVSIQLQGSENVSEDGGVVSYVVRLIDSDGRSVAAREVINVEILLPDGSTTAVQIQSGQDFVSFTHRVERDDLLAESDEVSAQVLSYTGGASFENLEANLTPVITNVLDDNDLVRLVLEASSDTGEDGGVITYSVSLQDAAGNVVIAQDNIQVTVLLPDGTITPVSILPGEFSSSFNFSVTRDDPYIENDTAVARLVSAEGGGAFERFIVDDSIASTRISDDVDLVSANLTASTSASEDGGEITYTVTLEDATGNSVETRDSVIVSILLPNGELGEVLIAEGESSASLIFDVALDDPYVDEGKVSAQIDTVSGGQTFENLSASIEPVQTTILDDADKISVVLSASESASEDGGVIAYGISIKDESSQLVDAKEDVSVTLMLPNGTTEVVTISAGQSSASTTFHVSEDDPYTENDSALAKISHVAGGESFENLTYSQSYVSTTLVDDSDTVYVQIEVGPSVAEEADSLEFTIKLVDAQGHSVEVPSDGEVTVDLRWEGEAANSADVGLLPNQVTLNGGAQTSFNVNVLDDSVKEELETLTAIIVGIDGKGRFENLQIAEGDKGRVTVVIDDAADNPPESRDFTITLDDHNASNVNFEEDNISDEEDDADLLDNKTLSVVITELPQFGQLFYGSESDPIDSSDLHLVDDNGVVTQVGREFSDPNLIRYEQYEDTSGFILGVKDIPEGITNGPSSNSEFFNWGMPTANNSVRELSIGNDTVRITSTGGELRQYQGNANHVGYGIGVGGGNGINGNDSIYIDFEERPATSISLGLDGLGGYFIEEHSGNKDSQARIVVDFTLPDGSEITEQFDYFKTDNSGIFREFNISTDDVVALPEGSVISGVTVSTEGPGNWELRYIETDLKDDFDYKALDSDGNFSSESTVSVIEGENRPPEAMDDPGNYSVKLGEFATDNSWDIDGINISTTYDGRTQTLYQDGTKLGVTGESHGRSSRVDKQIEFDNQDNLSERIIVALPDGKAVSNFKFAVSNLYAGEGDVTGSSEQGAWVAYLGDNPVGTGTFENNSGHRGSFTVELNDKAFDRVEFFALDYTEPSEGGRDSSDFFLTGFEASSTPFTNPQQTDGNGYYATNVNDSIKIPVSELLSNDNDPDGDILNLTHVFSEQGGVAEVVYENEEAYVEFTPFADFNGKAEFKYQVIDADGNTDTATVSLIVNPKPVAPSISEISLDESAVFEGDVLVYEVELSNGSLGHTTYPAQFGIDSGSLNPASATDVNLGAVQFTNGVTYDGQTITVPSGVAKFHVLLPTVLDEINESIEAYTIDIGGVIASGEINNIEVKELTSTESRGEEDQNITLDLSISDGNQISYIVIDEVPSGAELYIGELKLTAEPNGTYIVESDDVGNVSILPSENDDRDIELAIKAFDESGNELPADETIDVKVLAATDGAEVTLKSDETVAQIDFEGVDLGKSNWKGNIDLSTDASLAKGEWGTDNPDGVVEVGKASVYNRGDSSNQVLEVEGRRGQDDAFHTQFKGKEGQFYELDFDVVARKEGSSPLNVTLVNLDTGGTENLYDFDDTSQDDYNASTWQHENILFKTQDDGNYQVVFKSDQTDSYGALVDDITLETNSSFGYEGDYFRLADVEVNVLDKVGVQEPNSLEVLFEGLPEGSEIKNKLNEIIKFNDNNQADVSEWDDYTGLQLKVTDSGEYTLVVSATTQDSDSETGELAEKVTNSVEIDLEIGMPPESYVVPEIPEIQSDSTKIQSFTDVEDDITVDGDDLVWVRQSEGEQIDTDILEGEAPEENTVDTGTKSDSVNTGSGDDEIDAGAGDDIVQGGPGNDILTGGEGDDIFVWSTEDLDGSTDVVTDFNTSVSDDGESDIVDISEVVADLEEDDVTALLDNIELSITDVTEDGESDKASVTIENSEEQSVTIEFDGVSANELTTHLFEQNGLKTET